MGEKTYLDGLIRANQFTDSRTEPLLANRALGGKIANRRFETIRANRSHVMKIGCFLQIDSRESNRRAI